MSRQRTARTPKVTIQPARHGLDRVIDTLVTAWNAQARDTTARTFFGVSFLDERSDIIADSLYRYPEREREFIARQLAELADAINAGVFPWVS